MTQVQPQTETKPPGATRLYQIWHGAGGVKCTVGLADPDELPYELPHAGSYREYEYGYGGGGPAHLALSILADYFEEKLLDGPALYIGGWYNDEADSDEDWFRESLAVHHHHAFKERFIAPARPHEPLLIRGEQIAEWLEGQS